VSGNVHALNEEYITETNPSGTGASIVNIWFVIGAQLPQYDSTNFNTVKMATSISAALQMIFSAGESEFPQVKKHNVQQPASEAYLIFYDATSGAGWHVMPQDRLIIALAANSSDPGYMAHLWFSWGPVRPPMFFTTDATRLQFAGDYMDAVNIMLMAAEEKK